MVTQGITGNKFKVSVGIDIDVTYYDKHGAEQFDMTLTDVLCMETINFNLCSLSRMHQQDWTMQADGEAIVMSKGDLKLALNIVIPT